MTIAHAGVDQVLLVKTMILYNNSGAPVNVDLFLQSASQQGAPHFLIQALQAAQPLWWTGWFVLEPGDQLGGSFSAALVDVWVFGAVLPLPLPA